MSSTSENPKGKRQDLPIPFLILAVIGLVIIGVFVAFGNKIFKKKEESNSTDLTELQESVETKAEVVHASSDDVAPKTEELVFTAPEQIPEPTETQDQGQKVTR